MRAAGFTDLNTMPVAALAACSSSVAIYSVDATFSTMATAKVVSPGHNMVTAFDQKGY
jgi:hypothetical protein